MFFLDKTGLEHLCNCILAKLSNKVDKVNGKGLSTNDYTDEDKNNLTNLNTLVGDTSVTDQITIATSNKKEKDLIVTYQGTDHYHITHSIAEINEAVNNGRTVYFQKDAELLSLLEITESYATFYICYVNIKGKIQQKIVAVSGDSIMLEQDDTYDYVLQTSFTNTLKNYPTKTDLNSYYTKTETENYVNEAISNIEFPEAGETTSVQGDWEENDETNPAYIKNRTHYKSVVKTNLVSNYEPDGSQYISLYYEDLFSKLAPNSKCIVTFNGVEYETVVQHFTFNAYNWYIIGNGVLLGEGGDFDEALPFGIFIDEYNENWGEATEVITSLTIEAITEEVVKIPSIYLPTSIGKEGSEDFSEIFNDLTNNVASGAYAHAENFKTTASGYASHAEGLDTAAEGYGAHAEGNSTQATSAYSHAEGWATVASGNASHSGGIGTIANSEAQTVIGKYNATTKDYFVVGKGSGDTSRANAFTVSGSSVWSASPIYIGGTSSSSTEAQEVATKKYVDDTVMAITTDQIDAICGATIEI